MNQKNIEDFKTHFHHVVMWCLNAKTQGKQITAPMEAIRVATDRILDQIEQETNEQENI